MSGQVVRWVLFAVGQDICFCLSDEFQVVGERERERESTFLRIIDVVLVGWSAGLASFSFT